MASRIRYSVYGRLVDIEGEQGNWTAFSVGADGKRDRAGFIVPAFLEEHELGTYLEDLFHEAATPTNGDIVRVSVSVLEARPRPDTRPLTEALPSPSGAGLQDPEGLPTHASSFNRTSSASSISLRPVRFPPGTDLRRALEALARSEFPNGGFVLSGIGSLTGARIRLAGASEALRLSGDFEMLTLSGSLSRAGAHLHMAVADAQGRVTGGHVCHGNTVRTTAEILVVSLDGWSLDRQLDPATGYLELVIARAPSPPEDGAA